MRAGARSVVGVDFSAVAVAAAQRRAGQLGLPRRYVVGELPGVPLRDGCADLVYTGKGALIWLPDLRAWARDAARLLRPGGSLFVYEAHPAVPLWTWDADEPRIRPDRGYFERSHVNDTFPARGAVERQATLGEIVTAVVGAGLELRHLAEYPRPVLAPGRRRRGGLARAAAERLLPAGAPALRSRTNGTGSRRSPGSPSLDYAGRIPDVVSSSE